MTTKVTVSATHGWAVDVRSVPTGAGPKVLWTIQVPAGATRDFYVHSGIDLLIHEVQPDALAGSDDTRPDLLARGPAEPAVVAGLPVAGYRSQPAAAIGIVNDNKADEEFLLRKLDALAEDPAIDKRWLAIGRTALEQAFMAINRAVFRPARVELGE